MRKLFKKQMNKPSRKKQIMLVSFLAVAGIVILAILVWGKIAPELSNQCRANSTSPIYAEAVPLANNSLLTDSSQEVALKIETNKGYKEDINCLYPLINYYMKRKDTDRVKTLFGFYGLAYGDDKNAVKMYKDYDVRTYGDVETQVNSYINGKVSSDVIFF